MEEKAQDAFEFAVSGGVLVDQVVLENNSRDISLHKVLL